MSEQRGPLDLSVLRGTLAVVTGAGNNGIGRGPCMHAAGRPFGEKLRSLAGFALSL